MRWFFSVSRPALALSIMVWALWGCASNGGPSPSAAQVRVGMDKDSVLELAGSPKRTFRSNGQDHWVYVFFQGEEEMAQLITFADNRVLKIGSVIPKNNWMRDLEQAESMEEFEKAARSRKRKRD